MIQDVMIDLETLGTDEDCVVISIGAVLFDPRTGQMGGTFYLPLEAQDQLDRGRKVTADTLRWWMSQSDGAKRVFHEKAQAPFQVLTTLAGWLRGAIPDKRKRKVWGNGSTFDISILEHMFKMYKIELPWSYIGARDLRTFKEYVGNGVSISKIGIAHNALDDAISQAKYIIQCLHRPPVYPPVTPVEEQPKDPSGTPDTGV